MKKLQDYPDEKARNRRKIARRREALDEAARAVGWPNWSAFETAIRRGEVAIPPSPNP